MYTLHVVFLLPILRDGWFLGKTLFHALVVVYSVSSLATHINMLTHPCPLQLKSVLGETIRGQDATILGWGQSLSSFIDAWRRFVYPRMVNRMISLTGSPRMPHSSISHQGQLLLWGIAADPVTSCYCGEPCIMEREAAAK